jgi:hypothetical protein
MSRLSHPQLKTNHPPSICLTALAPFLSRLLQACTSFTL